MSLDQNAACFGSCCRDISQRRNLNLMVVAISCLEYPKEGTRKSLIKDVILTVEENMAELLEKRDKKIQEMKEEDKEIAELKRKLELSGDEPKV